MTWIMQVIFFILGMFIDPVGMCTICSPVFLPIVTNLGFDPTWFRILFILNCGMAYLTPPFGFNLFYMRAIAPADCTRGEIYASVRPWVICEAVVFMPVMFFPIIGMWLPDRMEERILFEERGKNDKAPALRPPRPQGRLIFTLMAPRTSPA